MKNTLHHKLFSPTDCLSEPTLFAYIDKTLTHKEQHVVEKHLMDCEFCSDALEGLRLVKDRSKIKSINKTIDEKIAYKKEAKILFFNYRTVTSLAAAVALLIGGVFFFKFSMNNSAKEMADLKEEMPAQEISTNKYDTSISENVEQTISSQDSITVKFSDSYTSSENEKITNKDVTNDYKKTIPSSKNETTTASKNAATNSGVAYQLSTSAGTATKATTADKENKDANAINENDLEKTKTYNSTNKRLENYQQPAQTSAVTTGTTEKKPATETVKTEKENVASNDLQEIAVAKQKSSKKRKVRAKFGDTKSKSRASAYYYKSEDKKKEQKSITLTDEETPAEAPATEGQNTKEVASAYENVSTTSQDSTHIVVDESPQYPGGESELAKYIEKNSSQTIFLKNDANKSATETVYVQFTITKEGKAIQPKVLKSTNKATEQMLMDLINNMPLWKPGKLNGTAVNVKYTLPVKIYPQQ